MFLEAIQRFMEKNDQQNLFDNPAAIILLIAILVSGYILFSSQSQITTVPENKIAQSVITTIYTKVTANIRSCVSTDCKIIGTYPPNQDIDISTGPYAGTTDISQLPDWLLLNFPDGTNGYISKTVLSDHQTTQNTQTESNSIVSTGASNVGATNTQPKNLSSIIKEWRKSTAYIACFWDYSNGAAYYFQSGSGLVVMLNSVPTIITNYHVVNSSLYGGANECDIRFPDDSGFYVYLNNTPVLGGQGYYPNKGTITYETNFDVAYISKIDNTWISLPFGSQNSATISIYNRSRNDAYLCKNSLEIGAPIVILGYPVYGTQIKQGALSPVEITATEGIISGQDGGYYTTSAKIDHGNSGGLSIDKNNNCYFGIPTWNESGSFESLGRILPSSYFLHY